MAMDMTKDLKIATYDLQMARPAHQVTLIRECAEVMEDMLKELSGVQPYKMTKEQSPTRKKVPSFLKKEVDWRLKPDVPLEAARKRKEMMR